VFDLNSKLGANVFDVNLKRLTEIEKARATDFIKVSIRPLHYDVMMRKNRSKNAIEKQFTKMRLWVNQQQTKKDEIQLRMLRTCRMLLCHDYCEELT
jgi:hypothetical protein